MGMSCGYGLYAVANLALGASLISVSYTHLGIDGIEHLIPRYGHGGRQYDAGEGHGDHHQQGKAFAKGEPLKRMSCV